MNNCPEAAATIALPPVKSGSLTKLSAISRFHLTVPSLGSRACITPLLQTTTSEPFADPRKYFSAGVSFSVQLVIPVSLLRERRTLSAALVEAVEAVAVTRNKLLAVGKIFDLISPPRSDDQIFLPSSDKASTLPP